MDGDRPLIPLILGVVFLILGLLLRAIVAPLVLIGTVVLSFAAALGISALFFKHVFGFAVALGVLLDTIIVRSVLVTALTLDIGRHIWWPSALARHGRSRLANPESRAVTGGT